MDRSLARVADSLSASTVDASIKKRFQEFQETFSAWRECSWVVERERKWVLERINLRMDRAFLYVLQESQSTRKQISISTLGVCEAHDRDRRFRQVKEGEFQSAQCAVVGSDELPLCVVFDSAGERNNFVLGFKVIMWYLDGARIDAVSKDTREFGVFKDEEEEDHPPERERGNMKEIDRLDPIPDEVTYFLLRSVEDDRFCHRLRSVTFVGRSENRLRSGIDLVLDKADISRIHARFEIGNGNGNIRVFDEKSFGGTFVDGQAVTSKGTQAFVGSVVKFGQEEIFVIEFNRALLSAPALKRDTQGSREPDTEEFVMKDLHTLGSLRRCRTFAELDELVHEIFKVNEQHRLLLRIAILDGLGGSPLAPPVTSVMADKLLSETLHYLRLGAVLKVYFESAAQSVLLIHSHGRMI